MNGFLDWDIRNTQIYDFKPFFCSDIKKLRKISANRITKIKVYQHPLED